MSDGLVYVTRECESWLETVTPLNPILSVMGPRQAGKTEMVMKHFPHLPYFDLEDEQTCAKIKKDVIGFIRDHIDGAIFDEFHHIPEITQGLKVVADELIRAAHKRGEKSVPTRFVITGSHNYLMVGVVKETMVGRAAVIDLTSMTASEAGKSDPFELMFKGGYPVLHVGDETPATFFPKYIRTYLEREVRDLHGITDLIKFERFMRMCASRVGNIFDYEDVADDLCVKVETIHHWLSILYASYIIFYAPPYYKNFEKRLTKRPKFYFYDTGIVSYLLELESVKEIEKSSDKGKLFENLVISDIKKKLLNKGLPHSSTYFWNIEKGEEDPYEIDLMIKRGGVLKAIEIKSSDTFNKKWFYGGTQLAKLTDVEKYVVYTGPTIETSGGKVLNFSDLDVLF